MNHDWIVFFLTRKYICTILAFGMFAMISNGKGTTFKNLEKHPTGSMSTEKSMNVFTL